MLGQHIAVILQHHHVAIAYNPAIAEINEIALAPFWLSHSTMDLSSLRGWSASAVPVITRMRLPR